MSVTPHTDLGFDPEALRAKYRAERDRRISPDGSAQYRGATSEFGYYADHPYADIDVTREPLDDRVEVAIVVGGFGGLLAAARLRQAGVQDIRVIEKGGDFGGTWYWNRSPGIHCDIESYIYMPLLEEVGQLPGWKYAPGEEIRRHARAIGRHFDLYRDACFQTQVTELTWDEDELEWLVTTDRGDRIRARYVVVALGTLSRPKLPGVPGMETFRGHTFHTSRWDYGCTGGDADGGLTGLADKRVGLIGTGATAIQVVPHLGRDAQQLYVFQRTPSSVDVRGNRRTDPEFARTLGPGWQQRRRDNFLAHVAGGGAAEDLVDDGWTTSAALLRTFLSGSGGAADSASTAEVADYRKMNELRARVDALVEDPATAEALKPWYRYLCKRPTFRDSYLQTFNRPNVTLVDTADQGGVEKVTENAVVALGVSQAAVSRTLSSLEQALGVRLLRRTSRSVTPTGTGLRVVAHARRVLAEVDDLVRDATSGHAHLRVGYAWSALGRHTLPFQRRWSRTHPETDLHLVRVNSATAGLGEGACELAVVRRPLDDRRFESAIVGLERRLCAMASDDPLARRRSVRLADLAGRTLLVDRRTGTTTADLWPPDSRPATEDTHDVDDWLTVIATGRSVGMTAESTANQYPRPGVVYRPVRDGEPIAVRLAWWKDDPHPATQPVLELLSTLYREA